MKLCTKCGSLGPFPTDRSRDDGLHLQCKECHRARSAWRRATYPKATRASNRESMRRARTRDPERVREYNRRWRESHLEQARAYSRKISRAWYQAHPERWIIYGHQRRARKVNASGHATIEQIRARVAFFGGCCAYCRGPFQHIEHSIPLSRGGSNWPANIRPACAACNLSKHVRTWTQVQL